jgi:hypothetical protein
MIAPRGDVDQLGPPAAVGPVAASQRRPPSTRTRAPSAWPPDEVSQARSRSSSTRAAQNVPNSSVSRTSRAVATFHSDDTLALDSARSICDSSDTDSLVRRDICLRVRPRALRSSRIDRPIVACSSSSRRRMRPFFLAIRVMASRKSSTVNGLRM